MAKPGMPLLKHQMLIAVGVFFVGLSAVLTFLWPSLFKAVLYKHMALTPTSETTKIWKVPPVPIKMNFYFFNWTNPKDLGKVPPHLVEVGPYSFKEIDEKTNISWNDNGTVTFQRKRTWYFDEENSNGTLEDVITTINPIILSAANSVRYWNFIMKKGLGTSISAYRQKLEVAHTVGEMLFFGYTDPLLEIAKKLPAFVKIPYDRFGWFYNRNESDLFEGIYNMDTGTSDMSQFGKLHNWNYDNHTSFYEGTCGDVTGTAGELFPPEQTKDQTVEMFSADLCRSIPLHFVEETEYLGITGYKYAGGADIVDNGTLSKSNECYCDGECVPSGVINVTSCRYGAPGFVSFPHFYLGDPYYRRQVTGLHPDPDRHSLYITLEPTTGIPLDVAARFQINLLMRPDPAISILSRAPRVFFPMIWFEQRAAITDDLAFLLKIALTVPIIGQAAALIFFILGSSLISYYIYLTCTQQSKFKGEVKNGDAPLYPLIRNESHLPERIVKTKNGILLAQKEV